MSLHLLLVHAIPTCSRILWSRYPIIIATCKCYEGIGCFECLQSTTVCDHGWFNQAIPIHSENVSNSWHIRSWKESKSFVQFKMCFFLDIQCGNIYFNGDLCSNRSSIHSRHRNWILFKCHIIDDCIHLPFKHFSICKNLWIDWKNWGIHRTK